MAGVRFYMETDILIISDLFPHIIKEEEKITYSIK